MCADLRFWRNSQSIFLHSGSWPADKRDYPAVASPYRGLPCQSVFQPPAHSQTLADTDTTSCAGETEPQAIKLTEDQDNEAFLDDFAVEDDMEL